MPFRKARPPPVSVRRVGHELDGGYTAHEISPQAGGGLGGRSLIAHVTVARTVVRMPKDKSYRFGTSGAISAAAAAVASLYKNLGVSISFWN